MENYGTRNNPKQKNISSLHLKLDEFIVQLIDSEPDQDTLRELQAKFNKAITSSALEDSDPVKVGTGNNTLYKPADVNLGRLVITRKQTRKRKLSYRYVSLSLRLIIGLLLILLGFGMIIMPAPEYFEMFTLFYLNPNDGVTIMDIISLIVAFAGVIIFMGSLLRFKSV